MKRRRDDSDSLSLSFLDAISCGFGAIILLLVMTMIFAPATIQKTRREVEATIAQLQADLAAVQARLAERSAAPPPAPVDMQLLAQLRNDLTRLRSRYNASTQPKPETDEEGKLRAALQTLTEEMRRLLANYRPPAKETTVGGIPVDSEYVIFVIDNSGSMQAIWPTVTQKVRETLSVYPRIKGIQVVNSDGRYLLGSAKRWIEDSPSSRRRILNALQNWETYSSSNPTRGIIGSIEDFYEPGKRISVYVFGDDFMGGNRFVESVIRNIESTNVRDAKGRRLVRIHGVAFPTQAAEPAKFALFMRALCERNDGTFVALSEADMGPRITIRTGPFGGP